MIQYAYCDLYACGYVYAGGGTSACVRACVRVCVCVCVCDVMRMRVRVELGGT